MIRKTAALAALLLLAPALRAQNTIDLAACVDPATAVQIGKSNAEALRTKLSRIITRYGMADVSGIFALVPTLTVTDDGKIDTGMTDLYVVRADLTLSVRNTLDNTTFASQTVSLQASGKSVEACMRTLINRLNVNDVRFAKMLRDVQQSIAAYYSRQMPRILSTVNSLIDRERFEEAMTALAMIPECVDEYPVVANLKVQVYNRLLENEVTRAMTEADILVRQGDIDGALALCRACNPLSPNYGKVVGFLQRLDAAAAAAEAEALERKQREIDLEMQRERLRQEADATGGTLKAERAEKGREKGKSLGEWLFGL